MFSNRYITLGYRENELSPLLTIYHAEYSNELLSLIIIGIKFQLNALKTLTLNHPTKY